MVRDNVRAINSDANLQATSTTNEAGTQAGVRTRSSGTQREEWDTAEMPPELKMKGKTCNMLKNMFFICYVLFFL